MTTDDINSYMIGSFLCILTMCSDETDVPVSYRNAQSRGFVTGIKLLACGQKYFFSFNKSLTHKDTQIDDTADNSSIAVIFHTVIISGMNSTLHNGSFNHE